MDGELLTAIGGHFIDTRRGEVFVAEQSYPPGYRHGQVSLEITESLGWLAAWAQESNLETLPLDRFAFLDTETSGLAGGTGTYAFMVGMGCYENGEFKVTQFFMRDPSEEGALLEALAERLARFRVLITFNGKAFDGPLLATRYRLHALPIPFQDFIHLDLLSLARRLWRDRLPSRALKYLEENILMVARTSEEVPGYEIPYLYFDYLRTGDAAPLKGVFYHNGMDIVTMAALLNHSLTLLNDPLSEAVEHGLDVIALAKLFEGLGDWEKAARLFERGLQMQLPEADFWQAVRRLSQLQKKRGDLEPAVRLWEKAAAQGYVYAFIELAKYHEHTRRDYPEALVCTTNARQLLDEQDIPRYEYNHWMSELERRQQRLSAKNSVAGIRKRSPGRRPGG